MSFLFISKTANLNSALTKSYMDFFQCYRWILRPEKHGFRNQNLVSIYPRCGVISENAIQLAGGHFENGAI